MKWEVTYVHVIERTVVSIVEAMDEDEAILKAVDGDVIESDEDCANERGIEIKKEKAKLISSFSDDLESL